MGHLINPVQFRLGYSLFYNSNWPALNKEQYMLCYNIRKDFTDYFKTIFGLRLRLFMKRKNRKRKIYTKLKHPRLLFSSCNVNFYGFNLHRVLVDVNILDMKFESRWDSLFGRKYFDNFVFKFKQVFRTSKILSDPEFFVNVKKNLLKKFFIILTKKYHFVTGTLVSQSGKWVKGYLSKMYQKFFSFFNDSAYLVNKRQTLRAAKQYIKKKTKDEHVSITLKYKKIQKRKFLKKWRKIFLFLHPLFTRTHLKDFNLINRSKILNVKNYLLKKNKYLFNFSDFFEVYFKLITHKFAKKVRGRDLNRFRELVETDKLFSYDHAIHNTIRYGYARIDQLKSVTSIIPLEDKFRLLKAQTHFYLKYILLKKRELPIERYLRLRPVTDSYNRIFRNFKLISPAIVKITQNTPKFEFTNTIYTNQTYYKSLNKFQYLIKILFYYAKIYKFKVNSFFYQTYPKIRSNFFLKLPEEHGNNWYKKFFRKLILEFTTNNFNKIIKDKHLYNAFTHICYKKTFMFEDKIEIIRKNEYKEAGFNEDLDLEERFKFRHRYNGHKNLKRRFFDQEQRLIKEKEVAKAKRVKAREIARLKAEAEAKAELKKLNLIKPIRKKLSKINVYNKLKFRSNLKKKKFFRVKRNLRINFKVKKNFSILRIKLNRNFKKNLRIKKNFKIKRKFEVGDPEEALKIREKYRRKNRAHLPLTIDDIFTIPEDAEDIKVKQKKKLVIYEDEKSMENYPSIFISRMKISNSVCFKNLLRNWIIKDANYWLESIILKIFKSIRYSKNRQLSITRFLAYQQILKELKLKRKKPIKKRKQFLRKKPIKPRIDCIAVRNFYNISIPYAFNNYIYNWSEGLHKTFYNKLKIYHPRSLNNNNPKAIYEELMEDTKEHTPERELAIRGSVMQLWKPHYKQKGVTDIKLDQPAFGKENEYKHYEASNLLANLDPALSEKRPRRDYFYKLDPFFQKYMKMQSIKSLQVNVNVDLGSKKMITAKFLTAWLKSLFKKGKKIGYVMKTLSRFIKPANRYISAVGVLFVGRFTRSAYTTDKYFKFGNLNNGEITKQMDYSHIEFSTRFGMCGIRVKIQYKTNVYANIDLSTFLKTNVISSEAIPYKFNENLHLPMLIKYNSKKLFRIDSNLNYRNNISLYNYR